ncbi:MULTISPECIES: hypothetical protein [unclassified Chelatococcus]|uniref:hypothetical protein n=1 Tax=unclassified Chelatococcus TaxID=2638111 RepID=UPI001BD0A7F4|nr:MULTISPECIES: hypothetical protein [unclassified Chelatococcus]MBS7701589.1 hypothetical protein [Chelatococcus sp. YT9]MBX3557424.1 hypothetical protein [Chelatococcus sp.]
MRAIISVLKVLGVLVVAIVASSVLSTFSALLTFLGTLCLTLVCARWPSAKKHYRPYAILFLCISLVLLPGAVKEFNDWNAARSAAKVAALRESNPQQYLAEIKP